MLTFECCPECVAEDSGITLFAETQFPDGERQTVMIATNKWDADGEEMGQLLRQLLAAMGFAEQTINEVFGDDCVCYAEMEPKEFVEIAETPEKSLYGDWDGDFTDPCDDCDQCCSDTACLHEEPFDEV